MPDVGGTPFKVVVDPDMRLKLRRALIDLIDYHDEALAEHFAEGKLALESYKEYIELFARSLKETMESREGVAYLLRAAGFEVPPEEINLTPELRWKRGTGRVRFELALANFSCRNHAAHGSCPDHR